MDVNIADRGKQSKHLVQIKDQILAGRRITHILNVKVSNEPLNVKDALTIRNDLKRAILGIPLILNVPFGVGAPIPVAVTWQMEGAENTGAYYYTQSRFNDDIMAKHTRLAIGLVSNTIRFNRPEFGYDWGIAYMIVKPLALLNQHVGAVIPINVPNLIDPVFLDENDDEEVERCYEI